MPRCFAQRLLPSIMIATWRRLLVVTQSSPSAGLFDASDSPIAKKPAARTRPDPLTFHLDSHQIRFFSSQRLIYFRDVFIGDFLNFILSATIIIFTDFFIF